LPKRPEVKPTKKVKNLQWAKLPPAKLKGTLFEKWDMELKGFSLDFTDIEDKFAQKVVEAKEGGGAAVAANKGPVSLIDPKLGQNLCKQFLASTFF